MNVRNLIVYCFSYNRDHRGRLFDVHLAAGPATVSLPGSLFLRAGVWASLMLLSGFFTWHSWSLATRSDLPSALEHRLGSLC